ncbi:pancreatic triacylglycerol lipase-like [Pieris brassicae]|uniref:pancreatic triacylglycerol lipase-like n=1 Tax=Pieris brassicae TaxID=7116 RepID=UPI001E65FDF3|nr:pancreatic triacylglycerol lipase-like [Pieris brassicae]
MLIQLLWCILLTSFKCTCFNILTTDELENHISPEDLREFLKYGDGVSTSTNSPEYVGYADIEDTTSKLPVPNTVDCFGLGNFINKLGFLNMKPGSSDSINTHFYFSSRQNPLRVQVYPGDQFGLEWVDFDPSRRTAMIVHGFMSHSNASWVLDMTNALLNWADLNVIAVDWSKGGDTWKYWRAVANTRRVGSDVTGFMRQLIAVTGARLKDFHFIGHSLGAHIVSYVSFHLGRVARITGLDPAQPCYGDSSAVERLDPSDADFVDVIHTNGRLLQKIGFGLPDPIGHADFYPNGGMQQPGCVNRTRSLWSKLIPFSASRIQQAICSHGRAYMLFTESLINDNCTFRAYRWNLTYEGVNSSLVAACDRQASCAEMGINAIGGVSGPKAKGPYFVLTTEREPYCPTEWQRQHPRTDLLRDLKFGFRIDRSVKPNVTQAYGDPFEPTTQRSWFRRLVSFG